MGLACPSVDPGAGQFPCSGRRRGLAACPGADVAFIPLPLGQWQGPGEATTVGAGLSWYRGIAASP